MPTGGEMMGGRCALNPKGMCHGGDEAGAGEAALPGSQRPVRDVCRLARAVVVRWQHLAPRVPGDAPRLAERRRADRTAIPGMPAGADRQGRARAAQPVSPAHRCAGKSRRDQEGAERAPADQGELSGATAWRIFSATSFSAPAKGWKVKRTVWVPGGTTMARKMTLALRMSVETPSMLARHQGCQTSLSTRMPPAGASTAITTSVPA